MEKYYVLKQAAVPPVLLRVVEAKRLLESGKVRSIQDAADEVGISRSSFYKYKDMISVYYQKKGGRLCTLILQVDDGPGMLLKALNALSEYGVNIVNIHQGMSINGVANIMLVVEIPVDSTESLVPSLVENIGKREGVYYIKVLAKE